MVCRRHQEVTGISRKKPTVWENGPLLARDIRCFLGISKAVHCAVKREKATLSAIVFTCYVSKDIFFLKLNSIILKRLQKIRCLILSWWETDSV